MTDIQIILQLKIGMSRVWVIPDKSCVEQAFFILHLKFFPSSPAWLSSILQCKSKWGGSHTMKCWVICDCSFFREIDFRLPSFSTSLVSLLPVFLIPEGEKKKMLREKLFILGSFYFKAVLSFFSWKKKRKELVFLTIAPAHSLLWEEHANGMWGLAGALLRKKGWEPLNCPALLSIWVLACFAHFSSQFLSFQYI